MGLKNYWTSESGNISMMAAGAVLPCILCVGTAMDTIRYNSLTADMQAAADSGALAGAVAYARSGEAAMQEEGKALFTQNKDTKSKVQVDDVTITIDDEYVVEVNVKAYIKPLVMSAFGYKTLDINVMSQATVGGRVGAEIAIAIDATNSMAFGSSWNDTIGTISNILDDLKKLSEEDEFYITLVPFQDRVNIDESIHPSWIKKNGHYNKDNWDGCVEPREEKVGSFDWMLTTEEPNKGKFEPTLNDSTFEYDSSRDIKCPQQPITGPTNDVDKISQQIQSLSTSGTGRYDVGLAWAWRALTPEWKGAWGEKNYPFDPKDMKGKNSDPVPRKKYLIYMTDGRSNAYKMESMKQESWGWNNGSKIAFDHIAEICNKIKADDIEIFMLHIPGNSNSTPYFKGCASSPDHYVVVDAAKDVEFAFEEIRNSLLSELRIVQ